uniref:Uncharacterized protein n=1 Tax=Rhizophora mucronata TaxID=61149 RepID=A0A2P2P7L6_RHIMU
MLSKKTQQHKDHIGNTVVFSLFFAH